MQTNNESLAIENFKVHCFILILILRNKKPQLQLGCRLFHRRQYHMFRFSVATVSTNRKIIKIVFDGSTMNLIFTRLLNQSSTQWPNFSIFHVWTTVFNHPIFSIRPSPPPLGSDVLPKVLSFLL